MFSLVLEGLLQKEHSKHNVEIGMVKKGEILESGRPIRGMPQ